MPGPSVLTRDYSGLIAAALIKYKKTKTPMDNITARNSILYMMVKNGQGYVPQEGGLGERMGVVLRYQNQKAEPFGGWDVVNTASIDGVTHGFWPWAFASAPISISLEEQRKARGDAEIYDILGTRTEQALDGLYDLIARSLMRGNGDNVAAQILTPYTRPSTGRTMFDPLPSIIRGLPAVGTVGNIDSSVATNAWWRNQVKDFTGLATFAAIKRRMDELDDLCAKTPSGATDLMVGSYATVQSYEALINAKFTGTDYDRIDIPFGGVSYRGKPYVKDDFVPDFKNVTTVETTGSYLSINSKRLFMKYDPEFNFDLGTDELYPVNQLGFVKHAIWIGGIGTDERRAHGVGMGIDLAVAA